MFLAIDRIAYDRAVLFAELASVSAQVGATRSRSAKVQALAESLRALADRTAAATGDAARGPSSTCGAGRGDRLRRHPDQPALPGRDGVALRPACAATERTGTPTRPTRSIQCGACTGAAARRRLSGRPSRNDFGYLDLQVAAVDARRMAVSDRRHDDYLAFQQLDAFVGRRWTWRTAGSMLETARIRPTGHLPGPGRTTR